MAVIVFDVALYTSDHIYNWGQCECRKYLDDLTNIQYKNLNYNGANLEDVVFPLNTWLQPEEDPLTAESFPFVMYHQIDTKNTSYTKLIVHRTLESLLSDEVLKNFNPDL